MKYPHGKKAWTVKVGERGQFVIPKEAREMFGIEPGDSLLLLGDAKRGLAIPPKKMWNEVMSGIFAAEQSYEQEKEKDKDNEKT